MTTATKTATPWGSADVVEEVKIPQQAGDRRFASTVQLLETQKGERLVRFAYTTDGQARRGAVTVPGRGLSPPRGPRPPPPPPGGGACPPPGKKFPQAAA